METLRSRPARTSPTAPPAPEPDPPTGVPAVVSRSAWLAAAWTGFGAAAIGAFLAVVVAVVLWIPDATATGSSGATVRAGVLTFLAGQRGGVVISGVPIAFVPLGLTLLAGWLCWRSARVLAALPVVAAVQGVARMTLLLVVHVAAYAGTCLALTSFAVVGTSRAPAIGVTIGAACVSLVFSGSALLLSTDVGDRIRAVTPATLRAAIRGGTAMASTMALVSAGLVACATLLHVGRALELTRALGATLSGLPVALLNALSAPNAVAAGVAYLAGPGFAVGTDVHFSAWGNEPGVVPGFPVLAGLPGGHRASPVAFAVMLLMLTLMCVVSAAALRDEVRRGWPEALRSAVLCAVVAASVVAAGVGLAGGSLGRHRLTTVGGSPIQVWGAVFAEALVCSVVGVVSLRVVLLLRGRRSVAGRRAG
ncbi:MAG TPA: DUF6350 family protein [Jatrophihabitantaceae bacterium]|nr:DUF6350 family protein [Jatrophihabitantaceae bacterium]